MSIVSSELNALQLDDILGSSLAAVVKAQGLMASQLAEFIEKVGFEPAVDGKPLKARTFSFAFNRSELDKTTGLVSQKQITAEVPLLSILSLPSLAVDEATLDFNLRIVAHETSSASGAKNSRITGGISPTKLFAAPARNVATRSNGNTTVDTTGALAVRIVARHQETLGLQKIQSLLESATGETQT